MKILYKQNILLAWSEFRPRAAPAARAGSTLSLCIFYLTIQPPAHPHHHSKAQELSTGPALCWLCCNYCSGDWTSLGDAKVSRQLGFGPRFGFNSLNVPLEQGVHPSPKCVPGLWSSSGSWLGNLFPPVGSNSWQHWAAEHQHLDPKEILGSYRAAWGCSALLKTRQEPLRD